MTGDWGNTDTVTLQMGRWGDGEMGRWGDAVRKRDCLMAVNSFPVSQYPRVPASLFPRVPVSPCPPVSSSNSFAY
ncbi:hypothetical protein [Trichormus sp. NMC-1]|uniref:hypothetical protein n=1 Tax=Trichormus sp. NMC-1 TaxID=1853259 RepID=UPI00115F9FA5|nr:hypothetical protein [Trichormus sp. NMC-1]